jgi:hypothetical protein
MRDVIKMVLIGGLFIGAVSILSTPTRVLKDKVASIWEISKEDKPVAADTLVTTEEENEILDRAYVITYKSLLAKMQLAEIVNRGSRAKGNISDIVELKNQIYIGGFRIKMLRLDEKIEQNKLYSSPDYLGTLDSLRALESEIENFIKQHNQ